MTRNLFFACALVSGAVLATGWALAPGCKGSFCFGTSSTTEAEPGRERASDVPGAGRELLGVTAQETAPAAASEAWLSTEDSETSWAEAEPLEEIEVTARALEPEALSEVWRDRQIAGAEPTAHGRGLIETYEAEERPELSSKARKAQQAAAAKVAKQWDTLAEAALNEPDDELRGEAINGVGLHRNHDSVAVLTEVAVFDPAPDNRLQAVQQLWYSAADGLDGDGGIRSTLQAALDDPDDDIAEMAEKALADLQAQEEARDYN